MKSDVCRFVVVVMTARLRWCSGAFGRQVRKFFAFVSGLLALIWWMPASAQIYQEWVARYRGPAGSESVARAMVLDAATNIIVTGGSYGEYATVKYDSNGNEIWEARYHGPGLGDNFARAVAVDGARNSYVTGWSYGSSNNFDYATVKYDPNGNQLWVARYNSPENTNDFARVIAVDKAGNVYVTGTSAAQMEPFDEQGENGSYTTIKYDANGIQLWVARYAGENDNGFRDSQAYAIAVDSAGNVYVTGYSTGSGSFDDFCTIKYDPNGNQLWVARYDGSAHGLDEAYSLALDSAGNVYVTGGSNGDSSYDYATVKYDTNGNQLWVARYNGPADYIDEANAIAVDRAGNVYVTGNSAGTSQTDDDMATIKYDANGNELWVARYGGTLSDKAFAIALDDISNVYVAGYSDAGFFIGFDYATVKYDANGTKLWAARYNGLGTGSSHDVPVAIAVDTLGNAYVTGLSEGGSNNSVYATIKYDSNGNQLWVARYHGPSRDYNVASALALDSAGNVYVTGLADYTVDGIGRLIGGVYATIKYDTNGNQPWVARRSGPQGFFDAPGAIALDAAGNVYVAGISRTTIDSSSSDYLTLKYGTNGNELWARSYNGPGNSEDVARALAVDKVGNVYVTGSSYGLGTYVDYATVKYVRREWESALGCSLQ